MIRGAKAVATIADALHEWYPPVEDDPDGEALGELLERMWAAGMVDREQWRRDALMILPPEPTIVTRSHATDPWPTWGAAGHTFTSSTRPGPSDEFPTMQWVHEGFYGDNPGPSPTVPEEERPGRSVAPMILKQLSQLVEKAAATFVQVFITAWLASGSLGFEGSQQYVIAGVAAALTVVANGIPVLTGLPPAVDILYRAARTYAVAFLTIWAGGAVFDLSVSGASAAAWAALPLALTVLKSGLASVIPVGTASGAVLPTSLDIAPAPLND